MQYSPKLKKAMKEIKGILEKNDIAGFVIIHDPGFVEYLNHLSPSYSCIRVERGALRAKLKSSELPPGKAEKIAGDTYNMMTLMTDVLSANVLGYIEMQEILANAWKGTKGPGNWTSHEQQNN